MIRWRNIFIALLVSAWAHGIAAAILSSVGVTDVPGFCAAAAVLSLFALVPVGAAAKDQAESYTLERALSAESEVRRLRAELFEKDPR